MNKEVNSVTIIGAGLSGLSLAYFLKDLTVSIQIIEAGSGIGGRIKTIKRNGNAPIEMGATWFGKKHLNMWELMAELGLESFEQELGESAIYEPLSTSPPQLVTLPQNADDVSYRVKGGTFSVIEVLKEKLSGSAKISLNEKVVSIKQCNDYLEIITDQNTYRSDLVISTLPPNLLLKSIVFEPKLPAALQKLMRETHTWMGESIKIGLHYSEPFWRSERLSGTIFSNVGPVPEMYEHADYEESMFALKGFLNGAYHAIRKEERLEMILDQLRKYFGNKADSYTHYEEKVWRNDPLVYAPYEFDILPHQNNGNPVFREALFDGRLIIGGSETSGQFPGYMEGAIYSAKQIAGQIKQIL